jgi:hypothetical protein
MLFITAWASYQPGAAIGVASIFPGNSRRRPAISAGFAPLNPLSISLSYSITI